MVWQREATTTRSDERNPVSTAAAIQDEQSKAVNQQQLKHR